MITPAERRFLRVHEANHKLWDELFRADAEQIVAGVVAYMQGEPFIVQFHTMRRLVVELGHHRVIPTMAFANWAKANMHGLMKVAGSRFMLP
jgi:hypothetical protein